MKIKDSITSTYQRIEMEDGDYIRFSDNSWYRWYGESLEPCFFEEQELEQAYRLYIEYRVGYSG